MVQHKVGILPLIFLTSFIRGADYKPPTVDDASFLPVYSRRDIAIQEKILADADDGVLDLKDSLIDRSTAYNCALFHGEPGSGKTVGALGVVRHMGFSPFIIKPTDVSSGYYSETARNLEAMLNEALALCSGVGIIIDEGEKIFEKPEQENRDTKQTATALTGWLDEYSQSKRKDAIVIITANEIKHMPDHLLSRTTGFQFKFTGPDTPEKKAQAFLLYVTVSDDDRDLFIQQMTALFKEFPRFNGRDLRQIVTVGSSFKRRRDAASSTTPIDYKQAMEKIMAERKESGYYEKDVDDAERRHKEAMDQNANAMLFNLIVMAAKIGWELG